GDIKIDEFTTEKLKQYLIESGGHLKPSSLGHRIRFIKSLFKSIHEEGYILKNPAAKLKEPKLGQRIPKLLSKYEIEHLREGCHTRTENALFELFYSTDCRIGEGAKLHTEESTVTANTVIVHGKRDKEREDYF